MIVRFDNVNPNSSSGPNSFARKLANELVLAGHQVTLGFQKPDVQLSFIQQTVGWKDGTPTVLRLDGIYFNSVQDWRRMNEPIAASYNRAAAVIVQSEFDKELIFKYFGEHPQAHVIHNGTNLEGVGILNEREAGPINDLLNFTRSGSQLWLCASHWRPHKRLKQNVEAFLHLAPPDAILAIAGKSSNPSEIMECVNMAPDRIIPLGELPWEQLVCTMKLADVFVHLAWLDHCPNVVVDARAAGCKLLVSSAGGTAELVREGDLVIREDEWNFEPCKLYEPPPLDYNNAVSDFEGLAANIDIKAVTQKYVRVMESVTK